MNEEERLILAYNIRTRQSKLAYDSTNSGEHPRLILLFHPLVSFILLN
jgi:hypothetical protein